MTANLVFVVLLSLFEFLHTIELQEIGNKKGKYCINYKKRKANIQPVIYGNIRSLEGSRILNSSAIIVDNNVIFTNDGGMFRLNLRKGKHSITGRDINYGDVKIKSIVLSDYDSVEVNIWLPDGPPLIDKRM